MEIKYTFELENAKKFEYNFIDNQFQKKELENIPNSIELEFNKCSNCTLSNDINFYCPAAVDIFGVAIDFKDIKSHDLMKVTVEMDGKTIIKTSDVQSGLASFLGLVMATGQCPVLSKFKNIAKIHQPFTSLEETIIRLIGFEVLEKLIKTESQNCEFDLTSIYDFYNEVNIVNQKFSSRFIKVGHFDSILNSITYYFFLSKLIQINVSQGFEDVKFLFEN